MSQHHDNEEILEQNLDTQAAEEVNVYEEQEDIIEEQAEEISRDESKISRLTEALARSQADLENFKRRTERDKSETAFYIKNDILKKILPRLDDLERMIENTPKDMQTGALYEGIISLQKSLLQDLTKLGVEKFESIGNIVDPDRHEVMTQVSGAKGEIINEFEKGYTLGDRVLRVAKVVVGNGN